MCLQNINPTETKAWQKLTAHFEQLKNHPLQKLFLEDANRKQHFTIALEDLSFDYSRNRITRQTMDYLVELAKTCGLNQAIEMQFSGIKINETENRAVLHTAFRDSANTPVLVDGKDVKPAIKETLLKIKVFTKKVIDRQWKGYTGKPITDIVNIGVGGSHLGVAMVLKGLRFYKNHLKTHFISSIDGDNLSEKLSELNHETTLFIIVSKTFTTQETLTNAGAVKEWFLQSATAPDLSKHFVAVCSATEQAIQFGIDKMNIFPIWDWVGGRFSLWSAAGLMISLSLGFENFKSILDGGEIIDIHFRQADLGQNIPVVMALLSIWYHNFFNAQTEAIFSYTQYLDQWIPYLQQLAMESNGKSVDRTGKKIDYPTGIILWGGTGTDVQHAFMQLVHQGSKLIPADFIGFKNALHPLPEHHRQLMANYFAQMQALAFGKTAQQAHLELKYKKQADRIAKQLPFKIFEGNKPSNALLFDKLTPKSLGKLIALYEHKVFVQGIIWNIYSYDQFGVELGKELAMAQLKNNSISQN